MEQSSKVIRNLFEEEESEEVQAQITQEITEVNEMDFL